MYYAGIGARDCPEGILDLLEKTAKWLSERGHILRTGGANGCDTAFEKGCDAANGIKEIYIPWKGYNGSKSNLVVSNPRAFEIAKQYHPCYERLTQGVKKLHARNSHQMLGMNLDNPSAFVICYTKEGKRGGGTGQALRVAIDYDIPIFDFGISTDINVLRKELMSFMKEVGVV